MIDIWQYHDHLRSLGQSPATTSERIRFARRWLDQWPDRAVTAADVADWLSQYDGWTRKTYHSHLRCLYRWALETGAVDEDPTVSIRRSPTPRSLPTPLAEHELTRALEAASRQTRAFLLLGYLAGLRAHEIAKFHGQHIDPNRITVVGKGGQKWTVPTHPRLWELAQTYPRNGFWFPSRRRDREHLRGTTVSHNVADLFRSVGISSGAAHRARHTYATQLLRNGTNVRVVQTLMRHSSLATTERYLQVAEDEQRLAVGTLDLPPAA